MSNLKLLRTILRLKSLKITHFRCMHRDTELHLAVKPYKNGCRCPECGRRGALVQDSTRNPQQASSAGASALKAVGRRPTELGHPIQDVACEPGLGLPPS